VLLSLKTVIIFTLKIFLNSSMALLRLLNVDHINPRRVQNLFCRWLEVGVGKD
jgi:hypothetical protein